MLIRTDGAAGFAALCETRKRTVELQGLVLVDPRCTLFKSLLILCTGAFQLRESVCEYLLTQESCSAASFLPEVLHSQKQLNRSELMDDSNPL